MEIDRENIVKLSDEELFKTLRKCGLNVGPINKSTRSVYEKRLRNYLDGNSTISIADVTTTQAAPKESVAVLTAASLNETFPRARPEPKKEEPVQPIKKSNPEPPKSTLLDDVNRISVPMRPSEPTVRVLQAETNGYSSAAAAPSALSRMSYEPIAKSVERKSNELDFKLIRPAAPTATTSTSSFVPTSTAATRREVNYGLLDEKPTQPTTLSSGYKLPETVTPNIRSRATVLNNPKIESQYAKQSTTATTTLTKTTELKPKGKSSFKWTYYLLVLVLFIIVLVGMNFVGSNPETPVDFIN